MFDFERLEVYIKAKNFNHQIVDFLSNNKNIDKVALHQLRRSSYSIMLNIAEGSGRFSNADRCNFFVIARGSVFESVAVLDFLKESYILELPVYVNLYHDAEELSKMLFSMIKKLKTTK